MPNLKANILICIKQFPKLNYNMKIPIGVGIDLGEAQVLKLESKSLI